MDWGPARTRGAGHVVEMLRERWRHATLFALEGGPLRPPGILEVFQKAEQPNIPIFGAHAIYLDCVHNHLVALLRGGMLWTRAVSAVNGRDHLYGQTDLAVAMLAAFGPAGDWCVDRYPQLVAIVRMTRHLDLDAPLPDDEIDDPRMAAERRRRRGLVIVCGVLLEPMWTFQILTALSRGPARASVLLARVNERPADNGAVVGNSRLARGVLYRRLAVMRAHGLVEESAATDATAKTLYRLSGLASGLLETLGPVAEFGITHDRVLTEGAKARRGHGGRASWNLG